MILLFLRLLLNAGLIFAVAKLPDTSANPTCNSTNHYLPTRIIPVHYNVKLIPYTDTFSGESSAYLEILEQTRTISLHAYKLLIDEESIVLVTHADNTVRKPQACSYCPETQILLLDFDELIASGRYILSMKFNGTLHGGAGFVATNYTDQEGHTRQAYVTIFEPTGARRAFPCWDQPSWRTSFNISVEHPEYQVALSNMPVRRISNLKDGKIRTRFQTSVDLPTYLLTIAVLEAHNVRYNGSIQHKDTVSLWCRWHTKKHLHTVFHLGQKVSNFMSKYRQYDWREKTIKLVVFPKLPVNGVTGWAFAVIREEDITNNKEQLGHKFGVKMMLAHEMARQYTEGFLSPLMWSNVWLNKALALYLSYHALDEILVENHWLMELFVVRVQQPAMHNDVLYPLNITGYSPELDPFYAPLIYNKASAVIRMLEHIVTKQLFHERVINGFISINELHPVGPKHFWTIVHATKHEFKGEHGYTIKEAMGTWLSETRAPTLYVKELENEVHLTQGIYDVQSNRVNSTKWKIPLTFTTETECNFVNTTPKYWMTDSMMTLPEVNSSGWIIFNVQQSGYYRVHYSDNLWLRISRYLNDDDHEQIHPLNRAQIIDDSYHFLMTNQLNYTYFAHNIQYMRKEFHFIPWHSMMNVLQYMSPFLNLPESQVFKNYMLDIMDQFLTAQRNHTDHYDNDDMKKTMVLLVKKWSCKHGLSQCTKLTHDKLMRHLKNPEKRLVTGRKAWIYCAGMMNAAKHTVSQLTGQFVLRNDTKLLEHLTCVENETIITDLLTSIAINASDIWTQVDGMQLTKLYHAIVKRHARKENVLNFILKNFNTIMTSTQTAQISQERIKDILRMSFRPTNVSSTSFGDLVLFGYGSLRDCHSTANLSLRCYSRLSKLEKLTHLIMNVYSVCDIEKIQIVMETDTTMDKVTIREVARIAKLRKAQLNRVKDMFMDHFDTKTTRKCGSHTNLST